MSTTPDGYPKTAAAAVTGMANTAAAWVANLESKQPNIMNNLPSEWYAADDGVAAIEAFRTGEVWLTMVKRLLKYPDITKIEYFDVFEDVDAFLDAELYTGLYIIYRMAYQVTPDESNRELMTHYLNMVDDAFTDPRIQIDDDTYGTITEDDPQDYKVVTPTEVTYLR